MHIQLFQENAEVVHKIVAKILAECKEYIYLNRSEFCFSRNKPIK